MAITCKDELQGKLPANIHISSHPLSSLCLCGFSVSCLIIWQYTSSRRGSWNPRVDHLHVYKKIEKQ